MYLYYYDICHKLGKLSLTLSITKKGKQEKPHRVESTKVQKLFSICVCKRLEIGNERVVRVYAPINETLGSSCPVWLCL